MPVKSSKKKGADETRVVEVDIDGHVYQEKIDGRLTLSELTPAEVKDALNRVSGQYAFYANLRADVKEMLSEATTEFEAWKLKRYNKVDREEPKKTETWKNAQIIIKFPKGYEEHQTKLRKLEKISNKLLVLINAYEMQSRTLQSVLSYQRVEMEQLTLGVTGRGIKGGKNTGDLEDL